MTYYSDLATNYKELQAYEVSIEHFKELLNLSYEMINDLYEKRDNRRDYAISLQSYSIALSHLSKSVNKYHPQIPYLEVPALESMTVEESLSLEGFKEFISAIWKKIVEFFRALWNFLLRMFGKASAKNDEKINKELAKNVYLLEDLSREKKEEVVKLINEKFKVVSPSFLIEEHNKELRDSDTIDFRTYVDLFKYFSFIKEEILLFYGTYTDASSKVIETLDNHLSDIAEFIKDIDENTPNVDISGQIRGRFSRIGRKFSFETGDAIFSRSVDNREISLNGLSEELRNYYELNILKTENGIILDTVKIFRVVGIGRIVNLKDESKLSIFAFQYFKENVFIPCHHFITLSMIDENGSKINPMDPKTLKEYKVTVSLENDPDLKDFIFLIEEIINYIKHSSNRKVLEENIENDLKNGDITKINDKLDKLVTEYEKKLREGISSHGSESFKEAYAKFFGEGVIDLPEKERENRVNIAKERFKDMITKNYIQCWTNRMSLSKVLIANLGNIADIFSKEKEILNDILTIALDKGKKN